MKQIKILTNYPDATSSLDFTKPVGARQDNHSNSKYLSELERIAGNKPYSYLDLGCAGGQSVVDVYNKGYIACGIEGGDLDVMLNNSINGVAENWKNYKDKCLFKADITKPFELISVEDNKRQKFNIITAWDVIEHIKEEDVWEVIENIKKHLEINGVFICLTNNVTGPWHQCVKSKRWWNDIFEQSGFTDIGFDFAATPRCEDSKIREGTVKNEFAFIFKIDSTRKIFSPI